MVAALPQELQQEVDASAESLRGSLPEDEAQRVAYRRLAHKGYYRTPDGWQRLGPDISDKINLRQAALQPDGGYAVFDCDVFYSNAVKGSGEGETFTPEKIARAVENTNTSIESGGQAPGILKGHPHPLAKALSGEPKAWGKAINFRESPRGKGWVRCDLVDIDPDVYADWKAGHYIGLSAGFVNDAGDLNLRFGHVALLGGDMQALSYLPRTEIFAASDTLCFSADRTVYESAMKGKIMDKPKFSALFDALSKAYASYEAGEPGADAKVTEARKCYDAAFAQETPSAPSAPSTPSTPSTPSAGADAPHADAAQDKALMGEVLGGGEQKPPFAANPSPETVLPEAAPLKPEGPTATLTLSAGGGANFAAEVATMKGENEILKQQVAALLGKTARAEFEAEVRKLRADGYQFDAGRAVELLMAAGPNKAMREQVFALLQGTPKSALSTPPQFSAEGADNPAPRSAAMADAEVQEVLTVLRQKLPGVNFSAGDVLLGNAWMQQ